MRVLHTKVTQKLGGCGCLGISHVRGGGRHTWAASDGWSGAGSRNAFIWMISLSH